MSESTLSYYLLVHGELDGQGRHTDTGKQAVLDAFQHLSETRLDGITVENSAACLEASKIIAASDLDLDEIDEDDPLAKTVDAVELLNSDPFGSSDVLTVFNQLVNEHGIVEPSLDSLTVGDMVALSTRLAMFYGYTAATLEAGIRMMATLLDEPHDGNLLLIVNPATASLALPLDQGPRRPGDLVHISYRTSSASKVELADWSVLT